MPNCCAENSEERSPAALARVVVWHGLVKPSNVYTVASTTVDPNPWYCISELSRFSFKGPVVERCIDEAVACRPDTAVGLNRRLVLGALGWRVGIFGCYIE